MNSEEKKDDTKQVAPKTPWAKSTPWAEAIPVGDGTNSGLAMRMKFHEEATQDENAELDLEERSYFQYTKLLGDATGTLSKVVEKADMARNNLLASAKKKASERKTRREEITKFMTENGEAMGQAVHTPAGWQSHTPTSASSKSSATITTASGAGITPKKMDFCSPGTTPTTNAGGKPPVVDKLPTLHEDVGTQGVKRAAEADPLLTKTMTEEKILVGTANAGEILLMELVTDLPKELGFTESSGAAIKEVTMVGDCVVFLVEGQAYPSIYHKEDEYYFDSVRWQTQPINFVDQEGYPVTIQSMASLEHTLVVLSDVGKVYKAEYKEFSGNFANIGVVDFSTETSERDKFDYKKIMAVAIGSGAKAAYGFPSKKRQDNTPVLEASLGVASRAKLTGMKLPPSRVSAKPTSGNESMLTLGFDSKQRGLGYYLDGHGSFTKLTKFSNGVLVDVAASCTHVFGCNANGSVAYSTDLKNWSDFKLDENIRIRKIAAGASFVMGASDCGRLVVMKPTDGASNVLSWKGVNLANPLDAEVVDIPHIAAFKDDYIVAVVEVNKGIGHQDKKPRGE